jgi:hypothetical protein
MKMTGVWTGDWVGNYIKVEGGLGLAVSGYGWQVGTDVVIIFITVWPLVLAPS